MALNSPALNVMMAAARKAGRPLIRDFGEVENLQISMKGPADFVTHADQRTERVLIEDAPLALAIDLADADGEAGPANAAPPAGN